MTNIEVKLTDAQPVNIKVDGYTSQTVKAEVERLEERVETIITTPVEGVSAQEIIDARQGEVSVGANITEVKSQLAETTNKIQIVEEELIDTTVNIERGKIAANNKSVYDLHKNEINKNVILDDFKKFGVAETGQPWTVSQGGFKVVEGGLQGTSAGWNKAWIDTGLVDKEIELVVRTLDGTSTDVGFRLVFRYVDENNYFYCGHPVSGTQTLNTVPVVNSIVGSNMMTPSVLYPTTLVRIRVRGNSLTVYSNDVLVDEVTIDSTFSTTTKVGIFLNGMSGAVSGFRVNEIPKIIYPHNIVASVDNMLVVYDGSSLIYSGNGGVNFMDGLNIQGIGILKYIHLFSNGSVLFADDEKCYFSSDWKTYEESTVLDEDGTPYVTTAETPFYSHKVPSHKHVVNGKEIIVWGNYSIGGDQLTTNIKAWYSPDYGATVKCCYTANKVDTVKCRHIHNIDYYKAGNYFIMQTGDTADQAHWVKGIYNEVTDTWTWQTIGSGLDFKSTNIVFHSDGYAYYSWDLTPGGVRKVPIDSLSNVSTHELLFNTPADCGYVLVGSEGDILAFQTSGSNAKRYYYSKDQIKFHTIPGEYPDEYNVKVTAQYNGIFPANANGKILAGVQSMIEYPSPINYFTRKEGHVWIDEQLSKFGFPDAMK